MEHPKDIGDKTTLAIMLALRGKGLAVLVPFGENTRYDLVIDDGVKLERVQCKTGRLRRGAVIWSMCSNYGHHANPKFLRRDYQGEVDYFAVYCPETSGVYLIPMADLQIRARGALRIDPPRNGQRKFIRFAKQYEIGRVTLGGQARPMLRPRERGRPRKSRRRRPAHPEDEQAHRARPAERARG